MVYRVFVEKKPGFDQEAASLARELRDTLGVKALAGLRLLNRYDAENISAELFSQAVKTVFSEPQVDNACEEPDLEGAFVFAVEYLPGQFDRAAPATSTFWTPSIPGSSCANSRRRWACPRRRPSSTCPPPALRWA